MVGSCQGMATADHERSSKQNDLSTVAVVCRPMFRNLNVRSMRVSSLEVDISEFVPHELLCTSNGRYGSNSMETDISVPQLAVHFLGAWAQIRSTKISNRSFVLSSQVTAEGTFFCERTFRNIVL